MDSLLEQTRDMYIKGKTVQEISKVVGRGDITIRTWLRKLNIYDPKRDKNLCDYTNLDFFHNIDTEEKAYWLGFIYDDGCISKGDRLSINLSKLDSLHLQKLANIFNKRLYILKNYNDVILTVYSKDLCYDLFCCGINKLKTYEETTTVLNSFSQNLIRHFIRGYFDGDGSVGWQNDNKRLCYFCFVGSNDFLVKAQKIMEHFIPDLTKVKIGMANVIPRLNYSSHSNMISIYNWLYCDSTIFLERKKNKFEEILAEIQQVLPKKNQYFGVYKHALGNYWKVVANKKYIGNFGNELEAAYYHDLEQVRQRGDEAIYYMNFPSQYDNFVEWVNQGY